MRAMLLDSSWILMINSLYIVMYQQTTIVSRDFTCYIDNLQLSLTVLVPLRNSTKRKHH